MWPPVFSMIVAGLLCLFLAVVSADPEKLYKKEGDDVVFKPGIAFVSVPINEISWKDGPNIAIEWDGHVTEYNRHFKGRSYLNTSSGEMTLKGLIVIDTGLYTAEINGVHAKTYDLTVMSPVPKPTVSKSCDEEMTLCTLTCKGDIHKDAKPVTISWWSGDNKMDSPEKLHITKDDIASELSCTLENPVSIGSSELFPNPFIPARKVNPYVGLTVFFVLLVAVFLTIIIHRVKAGMWFYEKESMPWEANFWRKHEGTYAADSNGTPAQKRGATDEETPMT
ncbi:hypothetical protein PBY51_016864 [Eleginops maclovinus]|uniref:Ig-like domain-containing protein n=1 Tax=Eleginops maclovinus TaxID=56733 RepID=A0AAN7WLP6_ELEMC|nr:hypothetical protein PBY51_016864 [Eleginops maclovinus]